MGWKCFYLYYKKTRFDFDKRGVVSDFWKCLKLKIHVGVCYGILGVRGVLVMRVKGWKTQKSNGHGATFCNLCACSGDCKGVGVGDLGGRKWESVILSKKCHDIFA